MNEIRTVSDLMYSPDNIIAGDEPARLALPQFDAGTARSLIVVGDRGPLGVLTRQRAEALDEDELGQPVRDFVQPTPILSSTMSPQEAGSLAREADFESDRLPVVNGDGKLVGVVNREELLHAADTAVTGEGHVALSGPDGSPMDQSVASGMTVYGSDDKKLGEIDQVITERGAAVAFIVKHGLLGRGHKRIAAEHVTAVEDGSVRLVIGKMEFNQLADVDELEASRTS